MGILGLHCSQDFSERLFNAFDIDNDNRVSVHNNVDRVPGFHRIHVHPEREER